MPRRPRVCPAHTCFQVLNRAVARLPLFEKPQDYEAFERVLQEAWERESLPLYSFCLMPNHWHFVVCPETKNQLTDFFRWLKHIHTMRWHAHHHTEGTGHLYQGRFKTFPIEDDAHLLAVLRYVEHNPQPDCNSNTPCAQKVDPKSHCYLPNPNNELRPLFAFPTDVLAGSHAIEDKVSA